MCVVGLVIERKGMDMSSVCVFNLGFPPKNTYHSDTGSAKTSKIRCYENKHHRSVEERKGNIQEDEGSIEEQNQPSMDTMDIFTPAIQSTLCMCDKEYLNSKSS